MEGEPVVHEIHCPEGLPSNVFFKLSKHPERKPSPAHQVSINLHYLLK